MEMLMTVLWLSSTILASDALTPEYSVSRGRDNDTTKEGFIMSIGSPLDLFLFMDEVKSASFDYLVECHHLSENVSLAFRSEDKNRFVVEGFQNVHISCKNATKRFFSFENASHPSVLSEPKSNSESVQLAVSGTVHLQMAGILLGRSYLVVDVRWSSTSVEKIDVISNDTSPIQVKYPITINRKMGPLDLAVQVVVYVFLVFVTLSFGCKLDIDVVKKSLKKPVAVSIGLGCQYIVMPMLGFAIAKIVAKDEPSVALGIFLAGCCPGGGASNIYSHLLNGDLSLSITMTLISTVAAIGFFPLWLYTLGKQFLEATGGKLSIPFMNIFTTLLVLILPLLAGVFIKFKLPKVRKVIMKVMTPVTVIAIIILLTVGIYSNLFIFKLLNPKVILIGCLLPYFGYIIGGGIALILRQTWTKVKTIAIETGMQNVGFAMIVLLYAFPPPDGQLSAVAPAASAVMTPLPLFFVTIIYIIYKKCNPDKYKSVPADNTESKKDLKLKEGVNFETALNESKESNV